MTSPRAIDNAMKTRIKPKSSALSSVPLCKGNRSPMGEHPFPMSPPESKEQPGWPYAWSNAGFGRLHKWESNGSNGLEAAMAIREIWPLAGRERHYTIPTY